MGSLRDAIAANAPAALMIGGLLIGMVFGVILARTNFCTMGAISDAMAFSDWRRFRAWMLATATALAGTQLIAALGVVDLGKTMYLAPRIDWVGNIVGGLLFGYGMIFAGGCASRNLVRAGGGDIRSLIVLAALGIAAYMAIGGVLGPFRSALAQVASIDLGSAKLSSQGLGAIASALFGLPANHADVVVTGLLVFGLATFCLKDRLFRGSVIHVTSGIGVGLCVVAGWALTGLAYDEMATQPLLPASLTFVRPSGDTLEWLQRFTAAPNPGFGVATTLGALLGAFATAQLTGRFRLATFADVRDTVRNLYGAGLMGFGGVLALGCTIGQGVTGFSTLAIGSMLALIAVIAGGVVGIKHMERLLLADA